MRTSHSRAPLERSISKNALPPDNRLAYLDNGVFAQHRAVGRNNVIQCVWLYEHAVNLDALRRFHHNLGYGLLGRRIERSALPFARHRWVIDRGPSDIDIDKSIRLRAEFSDWADERSQLLIDPESGPGWHLGVASFSDGSTGVSLVLSHYLIDGLGLVLTLVDAIVGNTRNLGYPPPRTRTRRRAVIEDAQQTARDIPDVVRALGLAARLARRGRQETRNLSGTRPAVGNGREDKRPVVVPGVTVRIDLTDWDMRAKRLGGTSSTLGAAFAAKFGQLIGRRRASDGAVTLQIPVSERVEDDTRSHAMSFARASIDPTRVTTDLRDARAAIKHALGTVGETADDPLQLAWLVPFTPKRALRRMEDGMVADPDLPVFYSNLGDVGSVVNRLDGTDAEFATARVTAQTETWQGLERMGGQMTVQSLRIPKGFVISVNAFQPGAANTKIALRELAAQTLAEFGLTGKIE